MLAMDHVLRTLYLRRSNYKYVKTEGSVLDAWNRFAGRLGKFEPVVGTTTRTDPTNVPQTFEYKLLVLHTVLLIP